MQKHESLTADKITVLLNLLDFQLKEIQRRQDREQQIFQWSTSLLLGVFGAIIALAGNVSAAPTAMTIKILASLMILFPVLFSVFWIFRLSQQATHNAGVVDSIQQLLHLFETGYYGPESPYPPAWQGKLKGNLQQRKTPIYYSVVMVTMVLCVVVTIWLVL
ncbi:MAG TPA: hypothetical protein PKE64_02050 [Anaerolineae bacterium]|nr:hypothetical protein [Anaerolineae bacterium]HMR62769.1 hypothetical protein [Anaerolineae bacterium]